MVVLCDTPVDVLCLLGFVGVWLGWVCVLVGVRVSYSSCCRLVSGWGWFLGVFAGCVWWFENSIVCTVLLAMGRIRVGVACGS